MSNFYRKYIGNSVIAECGDIIRIVAVDYDTDYMYGYSDRDQRYVMVSFVNNRIVRDIPFDRIQTMAEEGRVYTD